VDKFAPFSELLSLLDGSWLPEAPALLEPVKSPISPFKKWKNQTLRPLKKI